MMIGECDHGNESTKRIHIIQRYNCYEMERCEEGMWYPKTSVGYITYG